MKEKLETRNSKLKVLLIEDNPGDVRLIREMLAEASDERFELTHMEWLDEGLKCLADEEFDAILADLGLPDSQGLDTFKELWNQVPQVPIVVLTSLNDKMLAVNAVRIGAQDYLVKGQVDGNLLVRAIRYALERHRLLTELEKTRQREQEERERAEAVRNYQHYVAISHGQGIDEATDALITEYRDIVVRYVRAIRIKEDRPSDRVQDLARRLAIMGARARDVVSLHLRILNEFSQRAMPADERAFSNDARLVLVELMGNVMDIYRKEWKIFDLRKEGQK